jgi:hypothetical protein
MITIRLLFNRGWIIPSLAQCLRCRLWGGDHHHCWIDRCPAQHNAAGRDVR